MLELLYEQYNQCYRNHKGQYDFIVRYYTVTHGTDLVPAGEILHTVTTHGDTKIYKAVGREDFQELSPEATKEVLDALWW